MRERTPHIWGTAFISLFACASHAQSMPPPANATAPVTPTAASTAPATPPVLTKSGFDLVRVHSDQINIPLKFGHLVASSVRLDLDGAALLANKDYSLDANAGTVTLLIPHRDGSTLRATYLYDVNSKQEGVYGGSSGTGQSFNIAPGTTGMIGLAVTERLADGSAVVSNVYGVNQSFDLGFGTVKGGVFMGQRQQSEAANMFDSHRNNMADNSGSGMAVIESLQSKMMGGSATIDYQSVSDKFAGFSAMSGMDTNAISKEKGMKRMALGLTGAHLLSGIAGFSMRTVGNEAGSVTWRDASYELRGAKLNWSQSVVDSNFNRFADLREQDRDQLGHEKGLNRESLGLTSKTLAVDTLKVQDQMGNGLYRSHASLGLGKITVAFTNQRIDDNFNRFGDLREQDKAQLAREAGLSRQSLTVGAYGITAATTSLHGDKGNFDTTNVNAKVGSLTVAYGKQSADPLFDKFASLTPQDATDRANQALAMIDPSLKAQGPDAALLANMAGFDRSSLYAGLDLGKKGSFSLTKGNISENGVGTDYSRLAFVAGGFKASYAGQTTADNFADAAKLLFTEQQKLGIFAGLHKNEFQLTDDLGAGKTASFDQMTANDPTGQATRTKASFERGNFGFNYIRRSVSAGFNNVGSLADPEIALFSQLKGQDQAQMDAHWALAKLFKIQASSDMRYSDSTAETVTNAHDAMTIGVGTKTSLTVTQDSQTNNIAGVTTHSAKTLDTGFITDLGKMGVFEVHHQQVANTGTTDTSPSAEKNDFKLTTKVTSSTDLITERADTKYSDGTHDSLVANTVRTALNPRVSVSVTDSHLDHANNQPTENHRELGAAIDFGKGIKLSVGMARQTNLDNTGTQANNVTMTGGDVQGIKVDNSGYTHNGWDDTRDQHLGHVSFANVKPMSWGILKDVHFHYLTDTARDNYVWQKEVSDYGIGASIGNSSIDFGYLSQMDASGYRAIDRSVKFTSDKAGKSPLRFNLTYGVRTLPTDDLILFRDYSFSWAIKKNLILENSMTTNPLQSTANVLLNSVPLDQRSNQWSLKLSNDPKNHFQASWKETRSDNIANALYREASLTYTMFADNPSPINLTYGLVEWTRNGDKEGSHRLGISYIQRPGPNQSLTFAFETLNFDDAIANNNEPKGWVFKVDFFSRH